LSNDDAINLPDPAVDPERYRNELIAVTAGRDPLQVIAETPGRIRELVRGRSPDVLDRRPGNGGWSATEIIGHLLDDEIVNGFRLRLVLTSDRPSYPGNEPDRWAALSKPPLDQVLAAWEGLREYNLWLLRSIPRSDWSRIGLHAEQGPETVEMLILKNAGHDLAHIDQLRRCFAG
jgi:DinB superfamily